MSDQGKYAPVCDDRTGAVQRYLQLPLPACDEPAGLAREVTRDVLTAWRLAHLEETAVLLVSELVTSAVRHATSTDAITLEFRVLQTWLRIDAYLCPPCPAVSCATDEFDETVFGFVLVDCLAGKWGWIAWPAGEAMTAKSGAPHAALLCGWRGAPGGRAHGRRRRGRGRDREQRYGERQR